MIPSKVWCTENVDLCVDNALGALVVYQLDYHLVVIWFGEVQNLALVLYGEVYHQIWKGHSHNSTHDCPKFE